MEGVQPPPKQEVSWVPGFIRVHPIENFTGETSSSRNLGEDDSQG